MRKKLVLTFIMCSMIGFLCLNGCAESETEQTLESVEETQEEIAEEEGTDETKEAIEVQGESNNQSSEKVIEEKEETKKTLQIGISDSDYEYIFGLNSMPNIFGVNLEPEDVIYGTGRIPFNDGTERYSELQLSRERDFNYAIVLILREEDISWLKDYLKEGVYQEGAKIRGNAIGTPETYELLKLEKKEEIETRYGNIQIVYFEGIMTNLQGDEFIHRKEIALFNVNNHDGVVTCRYNNSSPALEYENSDLDYEGKLLEVLPGLFEPKQ